MAVDTPVFERVPSRIDVLEEEEHNARIKDRYRRLINPENKIEDVFNNNTQDQYAITSEQMSMYSQAASQSTPVISRPYLVENARADAAIFRADSPINMKRNQAVEEQASAVVDAMPVEEENEDLRPTPTTIQYQTINSVEENNEVVASTTSRRKFGKREKIIVSVFVAVVFALLALVIINSVVIANLNADIAQVQDGITTIRGALAGVNATVEEIIHNSIGH